LSTATTDGRGVPGVGGRGWPGRVASRASADPVATAAVVLGVVVGVSLVGGAGRVLAGGALLGVVGLVVAAVLRGAWRARRTVAAPVVVIGVLVLYVYDQVLMPTYAGLVPFLTDQDAVRYEAGSLTRATLLVCGPVLVFAGVRRAVGWRRATAGTPWRSLVGAPDDDGARTAARRGVALAGLGALLVLGALVELAVSDALDEFGPRPSWIVGTTCLGVLALVVAPGLLASVVVSRRDRSERELAVHRQAVAAHLHDSVLQTFALIQRNLDDPERVRRLVRTQERELRAWLAGREVDALAETLAGALRAVADVVEEEHGVTIDLDVLDDPTVLERHRPLLEASREALRNAARHGGGAPIRVLAETTDEPVRAVVVWVRDDGPGFDPATIDPERRGVRDAIVGRMRAVGGDARIDTAPGAGTEVVLTLPTDPTEEHR
jgi:signal transduction histidine kinase